MPNHNDLNLRSNHSGFFHARNPILGSNQTRLASMPAFDFSASSNTSLQLQSIESDTTSPNSASLQAKREKDKRRGKVFIQRREKAFVKCTENIVGLLKGDKKLVESVLFKHLSWDLSKKPGYYTDRLGKRFAKILLKAFDAVQRPELTENLKNLFREGTEMDYIFRAALDQCPIDWMKAEPAVFELILKREYKAAALCWLGSNRPPVFLAFRNRCFSAPHHHQAILREIWNNNPEEQLSFLRDLQRTALGAWEEKHYPSSIMRYVSYFSEAPLRDRLPPREYVDTVCVLLETCFATSQFSQNEVTFMDLSEDNEVSFMDLSEDGVGSECIVPTATTVEAQAWKALSHEYARKTTRFITARDGKIDAIIACEQQKLLAKKSINCATEDRTTASPGMK